MHLALNQRSLDSFDLGSADEIGMAGHEARSIENSCVPVPSSEVSLLVKSTSDKSLSDINNTMNGLFACDPITNRSIFCVDYLTSKKF